ncbi:MAG: hypothetical protein P1U57_15025 [Oleibacter sp.]|nr:hypothetical protein [Thalassolituus sp.]
MILGLLALGLFALTEAGFFVLFTELADGFFLAGVEALVFVFLSVMLFCDVDLELELERDDAADLRGGCVMKLLPKNRGAMITSWSEQS